MRRKNMQTGQILLATLLVLMIAVTVGLSVLSRTTTDVAITGQVEESARAFSAAEAGLELALKTGVAPAPGTLSSGASYEVVQSDIGTGSTYMVPRRTRRDEVESIWFVEHNADGTLALPFTPYYKESGIEVCWTAETPSPAMVVSIIFQDDTDGQIRVARGAWDPEGGRAVVNRFSGAIAGSCGFDTDYRQLITFLTLDPRLDRVTGAGPNDILIEMRVRPAYLTTNSVQIVIVPDIGSSLPSQGNRFESTGSLGSGITRKILVNQLFRSASLPIFDAAIYSQSSFGH